MKTLELSRWIRQMLQHIQAHHGVEPLIGAAFEIPVHRELASKTERSCPLRSRAMTGMSPMQVAGVVAPSAARKLSAHGRTLHSALRWGVSEPVHPDSG